MTWSLVREFGIDYPAAPAAGEDESLAYPARVERRADGATLIVDELFFSKYLSVTAACRTLLVDEAGTLLYDSAAGGTPDGYGCLTGDGGIALLCRTSWTLRLLDPAGRLRRALDLSSVSKGMPRLVSWTGRDSFLVAFFRRVGDLDLAEVDVEGRVRWYLPRCDPPIGFAGSIQLLPNDRVLVADEFHHVALEVARDGSVAWRFGRWDHSAGGDGCLSNPKAAWLGRDDRRLLADTRNHRVLWVRADGRAHPVPVADGELCTPAWADTTADGHVLVCDAGNRRVVELDGAGRTVWEYGRRVGRRRWFSFPRSVEVTGPGAYLVADTANNRVVQVQPDGDPRTVCEGGTGWFWPRCVRRAGPERYVVADGRHSRVVEVTGAGEVLRELGRIELNGWTTLGDPHDVRVLPDGHLLIADASLNLAVEADWSGRVYRAVGHESRLLLRDPHGAQALDGGELLICDTGNSRILRVDAAGTVVRALEGLEGADRLYRFTRPRYAEVAPDGVLIVADSDNNRILAGTADGALRWVVSEVPDSPVRTLAQPRWVQAVSGSEVVVSDHLNHRVVHLAARSR